MRDGRKPLTRPVGFPASADHLLNRCGVFAADRSVERVTSDWTPSPLAVRMSTIPDVRLTGIAMIPGGLAVLAKHISPKLPILMNQRRGQAEGHPGYSIITGANGGDNIGRPLNRRV